MSTAFPPPVCFIHVPKTAGTSLAALLATYYDHDLISRSRLLFDLGQDLLEHSYRLWHGHYGIADIGPYLPADVRFVTSIRHPVERVASLYHYWRKVDLAYYRGSPETDPNHAGVMLAIRCQGLDEFLATDDPTIRREISDAQTRYLSGSLRHTGEVSADEARRMIIEHRIVVVRQRHLAQDGPDAIEQLLGRRPPTRDIPHLNGHAYEIRLTPAQRARIEELNQNDMALWRAARFLAASSVSAG